MRIAFYAPLKAPTHGVPSGDRRVAGLLVAALAQAGHRVELVSTFRSYDRDGDAERQAALRAQGIALGERLAASWRDGPAEARPALWFTYHVYYKAPDWLGPAASRTLGIPYVIAEASHAPKRAGGPWAIGHEGSADAIRQAALLFAPTRHDVPCLSALLGSSERIRALPPFLDPAPFAAARAERDAHRAALAAAHGIDPRVPWLVVAAMMRPGDKQASYVALAAALARLPERPWRLLVAGDGDARPAVQAALRGAAPERAVFLGALDAARLAATCAAGDLFVWPAVNEAYGMAMLEAQAAGLPVVSCDLRGVPDVVLDQRTGLLAPPDDPQGFADRVCALLDDPARRRALGEAAALFVQRERSIEVAAESLDRALTPLVTTAPRAKRAS
jgi:glycosyltransferase involved in cell wall biosynthesis